MLLGKVLKIFKKYKNIHFKDIRFNSKECKPNDVFAIQIILMELNISMTQ